MKRVVSVFFCFIFSLSLLMVRLFLLATDGESTVASTANTLTVNVSQSRGNIYDCNGELFVNETAQRVAVAAPMESVAPLLRSVADPTDFEAVLSAFSKGLPAVIPVRTAIYAPGVFMADRPVRYSAPFLIPHLAGYCDGTGHGVCGLEKGFDNLLSERTCKVTFPVSANGRVLCGEGTKVLDEGVCAPRGVVLTLDKNMQKAVREEMLRSTIQKGAAVLLEVGTGDIKAMVSLPEYDVTRPQDSLQSTDSPFINRAITPASVGSVYKMIVAAAGLEQGISEDFTYTCTGSVTQSGTVFHCHQHKGHGELQMADAMYHSCNPWFIQMARQIPVESILNLSWKFGLGSSTELCDSITASAGVLPDETELLTDADRANLAFGQGRLTATPLQIASVTETIANHGIRHEPRLILATVDDGNSRDEMPTSSAERVLSADVADRVSALLAYTASHTKALQDVVCGGKTATAQTGIYTKNGEKLNTWYSGYFAVGETQYVLTILCEDGISGATDCIPAFCDIAQRLQNP